MEEQTATVHAVTRCNSEKDCADMIKVGEMAELDTKSDRNWDTFQETVISLEVWEELEASDVHLWFQVKCEDQYQIIYLSL